MPTSRRATIAAFVVMFAGCSAEQRVTRGESMYGPINESRGGEIRYLAEGANFVVSERREDAYRRMFQQCGGRYVIDREWNAADGEVTVGSASATSVYGTAFASGEAYSKGVVYRYIAYSCVGEGPKPPRATKFTGRQYLRAARDLHRESRLTEAMDVVVECLRQDPKDASCRHEGALILWDHGQASKAENACWQVVESADSNVYETEIADCRRRLGPQ